MNNTMKFIEIISIAGYSIEAIGVLVVVVGTILSSVTFIRSFRQLPEGVAYHAYRRQLGRSIILGLEFLIAGDIIRTVIVADTLENVAVLGIIVLIRTFLSLTLHLEIEGSWPWQHDDKDAR
jgi:Predicted membrane protein